MPTKHKYTVKVFQRRTCAFFTLQHPIPELRWGIGAKPCGDGVKLTFGPLAQASVVVELSGQETAALVEIINHALAIGTSLN
jgi:hypothetical protein